MGKRHSIFFGFAVLFLLLVTGFAQESGLALPECFSNYTLLNEHIAAKDRFEFITYILCPNTIIELGDAVDGSARIELRQFSRIQCGDDGSSKNNCTLTGTGGGQVSAQAFTFDFEIKERVEIAGVTFDGENTARTAVLWVAPGDILFDDCVFKNFVGSIGPITLFFRPQRVNRQLGTPVARGAQKSNDAYERNRREVARKNQEELRIPVVFESCVFSMNTVGSTARIAQSLILAESDLFDIVVRRSVFFSNSVGDASSLMEGSAIATRPGSTLVLEDSCFVFNNFYGGGPVLVAREEDVINVTRNFGSFDDGLSCEFLLADSECFDYDLDKCPVDFEFGSPPPHAIAPSRSGAKYCVRQAVATFACVLLVLFQGPQS